MTTSAAEIEQQKQASAEAAALLVEDGQKVGLGTGSTVAYLLPALAARNLKRMRWVATSPRTEAAARALGLQVEPFELSELDVAIDGADQVAPDGWLIKGGGGAHTRERLVAAAADRFVVIASSDKTVERLHAPVPLELHEFGLASTLRRLPMARLRPDTPRSPDNGLIADLHEPIDDPAALAQRLEATPGIVDHGLFPSAMVHDVLIARASGVEHLRI
ncbi:ribose 5-phosphate isomerase A [Conexibacter sp. CPCC 206217]|uniref:ribose 5-phosphate isomerase A n=1 Tax=Conexibacter sp. CPCC 206217 TaxID=3064574 RepID=UPI0027220F1F|nr:ribose 5-phosphate isomerase A [Conexibacter sp. CPCC 206217]MDO8210607.1 ribose 5-phosphate isomerase A [Conexibacter sp. CPCC 206217]